MGNPVPDKPKTTTNDQRNGSGESRLRGDKLGGADQSNAVDHVDYEKSRDPDATLTLDDEDDTLYNDGLDVGEDSETYAETRNSNHRG